MNPNLRSIETFSGQKRIREFYAMFPEDAYSILEAIAEIHGCTDKLSIIKPNADEVLAEVTAQEIDTESTRGHQTFLSQDAIFRLVI